MTEKTITLRLDRDMADMIISLLDSQESTIRLEAVTVYADGDFRESIRLSATADRYREARKTLCQAWLTEMEVAANLRKVAGSKCVSL